MLERSGGVEQKTKTVSLKGRSSETGFFGYVQGKGWEALNWINARVAEIAQPEEMIDEQVNSQPEQQKSFLSFQVEQARVSAIARLNGIAPAPTLDIQETRSDEDIEEHHWRQVAAIVEQINPEELSKLAANLGWRESYLQGWLTRQLVGTLTPLELAQLEKNDSHCGSVRFGHS